MLLYFIPMLDACIYTHFWCTLSLGALGADVGGHQASTGASNTATGASSARPQSLLGGGEEEGIKILGGGHAADSLKLSGRELEADQAETLAAAAAMLASSLGVSPRFSSRLRSPPPSPARPGRSRGVSDGISSSFGTSDGSGGEDGSTVESVASRQDPLSYIAAAASLFEHVLGSFQGDSSGPNSSVGSTPMGSAGSTPVGSGAEQEGEEGVGGRWVAPPTSAHSSNGGSIISFTGCGSSSVDSSSGSSEEEGALFFSLEDDMPAALSLESGTSNVKAEGLFHIANGSVFGTDSSNGAGGSSSGGGGSSSTVVEVDSVHGKCGLSLFDASSELRQENRVFSMQQQQLKQQQGGHGAMEMPPPVGGLGIPVRATRVCTSASPSPPPKADVFLCSTLLVP